MRTTARAICVGVVHSLDLNAPRAVVCSEIMEVQMHRIPTDNDDKKSQSSDDSGDQECYKVTPRYCGYMVLRPRHEIIVNCSRKRVHKMKPAQQTSSDEDYTFTCTGRIVRAPKRYPN
ncbi:hypothetical protein Y032_0072g674 [Ancylostoma ceylanicum]|uniref:Uncharacterized protein n=1 Tax=Ancylostoma ceylanicum TaxID=53326 RepID=A0A016TWV3_9BILA|nr:hypothetical protein Y032_0072g674 [Ancylostoma ceylanicum]